MSVATVTTTQIAEALVSVIDDLPGLRAYAYVADSARVPCVVVGQPSVDYVDPDSGFCFATWTFPVFIVVARNNDRKSQEELSDLLDLVTRALNTTDVPDLFEVTPTDASPVSTNVNGQELPGYQINVRVRA